MAIEKYEKAEMEIVEFEAEDVITASCDAVIPIGGGCGGTDMPTPDAGDNCFWGD